MMKPAMVNANQVTSLIKELLILNRTESALAALPPNLVTTRTVAV